MAQVNLDEIEKRIEAGLIRRQWTTDNKLQILNYTMKCSIEKAWDEYTILTRGLILTKDGRIHSRSFAKFWNVGETPGPSLEQLPAKIPVVTRKMDGYLGVMYGHEGQVKIASRGSFTSEYALWATDWFRTHADAETLRVLDRECAPRYDWTDQTFVFEILHPKRIVVDNSSRLGLCLLAVVDTENGKEDLSIYRDSELVAKMADKFGISFVERFAEYSPELCLEDAARMRGTEEEGYILYYPDEELRVKIKADDYCKIHRIVTKLTERRVWELMSGPCMPYPESREAAFQQVRSISATMPDVYEQWTENTQNVLWKKYEERIAALTSRVEMYARDAVGMSRKDLVNFLQHTDVANWQLILAGIDGKWDRVKTVIWKSLRPEHSPALVQEGEDE